MSSLKKATILLPRALAHPLTYLIQARQEIKKGDIVTVPIGSKSSLGVVIETNVKNNTEIATSRLKEIIKKQPLCLSTKLLEFIQRVSEYTLMQQGMILKMVLPIIDVWQEDKLKSKTTKKQATELKQYKKAALTLSREQEKAAQFLWDKILLQQYSAIVLDGVTGAGKTEVYYSAIDKLLQNQEINNAQILIMLPEIALTAQMLSRFEKTFAAPPTIWHSSLTKTRRRNNFKAIIDGSAKVILGTRSALFLPYKNLKLIIVDEEHDSSYKQEEGVIYHARDMAVLRAYTENIAVILASATPALETMVNVKQGKYFRVHLSSRHGNAKMPAIKLIDMRKIKLKANKFISNTLKEELQNNYSNKQQSLLFLNRKGYAPLTLCRNCGYRFQCKNCSAWLVHHKSDNKLICHHCGYNFVLPKDCPNCNKQESLVACGPGIERVVEEIREFLPTAQIAVLTGNETTSHNKTAKIIDDIINGKIDIIVGTQVIAKGHHFPALSLVGIIDADIGLCGADIRAAEKTYQLLHQIAGRAGRERYEGKVLIQSYMPENTIIQTLAKGSRKEFLTFEMKMRQNGKLPPFSKMALIIVTGKNLQKVKQTALSITRQLPNSEQIRILGPAPAPMSYIRKKHRYQILLRTDRNINIQKLIKTALSQTTIPPSILVKIDIDPVSFV